ncbi:MAG TPA: DUF4038 domain-containing protein [Gemmataceae bacterium]|nr:DUF4038 domain-containing protein [Gemmataceae bacterium]
MTLRTLPVFGFSLLLLASALWPPFLIPEEKAELSNADSPSVTFSQSSARVEAYDIVEITAAVTGATAKNPFTDVSVSGQFGPEGARPTAVEGFCDAADGGTYRIRFMPSKPGKHAYSVTFRQGEITKTHTGTFEATDGKRRGVLRVDKEHPWHFVWEGTGEHYFFNGTTAYMLLGWKDEGVIRGCLDRLHRYKINRARVLLGGGRSRTFWGEPIIPNSEFRSYLNAWVAERPESLDNPGFDYKRFNVPHWQKFERMLRYARDKSIVISVVLDWNDSPVHPAALSDDEKRYYRYAAARLGAFSNITWDLGDDISLFRSLDWSHQMGTYLHEVDPYRHLATDHPVDNKHQDRTAEWFGFTSFQEWSRPQHGWMLRQREAQQKTGRIIPQTNEEYGYEDHYPKWAQNYPDGASAENMRRTAWEIYMAGCYQTTGETARRGTGYWPDTGGGWVNGRGDGSMVMLEGYARIVYFFEKFEYWKTDPHDELVTNGAFCLAEPGKLYAVYLPRGGKTTVKLGEGRYRVSRYNPRDGKGEKLPVADGSTWTSPEMPDAGDWALLLERES